MNVPLSTKAFKSKSKMKNLVCYILAKTDGKLTLERMTEENVLDLLKNNDSILERYRTFEQSRRDDADVVTEVLLAAGVIE